MEPTQTEAFESGIVRRVIEADLGRPVVSSQNYRVLKPPQPEQPKAQAGAVSEGPNSDAPRQLPLFLDPM